MEQFGRKPPEQVFTDLETEKTSGPKWELTEIIKQKNLLQEKYSQLKERLAQTQSDFDESSTKVEEINTAGSPELANHESAISIELQQAREDKASYEGQFNNIRKEIEDIGDKIKAAEADEKELIMEIEKFREENDEARFSAEKEIF